MGSPYMMISPTSYASEFPPISQQTDKNSSISIGPFVQSIKVTTEGHPSPLTHSEEVLNRHTKNATAQNQTL